MLRYCQEKDYGRVNKLLQNKEYQLKKEMHIIYPYRHYIILEEKEIKGVLIYDEIYDRFELIYIYVEKESRKKGYGDALMNYFINIVKEKKGINITLEVDEKNKAALNLYEKYHFKKVAIREKYYQNNNGYLMIRKM